MPKGVQKILVIPVEFSDVAPSIPVSGIQHRLSRMKDYYTEVSYGKIDLEGRVLEEWVRLPREMAYYGRDLERAGDDKAGNSRGRLQMVYDAVRQIDDQIDFSKYGTIIILHTGEDQAEAAPSAKDDRVWSYTYWDISIPTDDGVEVTRASIISEGSSLGVWVHEYAHQIGQLPDLWSEDGEEHYVGVWSPMDMGPILGTPRGSRPPHFEAWSKIKLGWLEPFTLPLNDSTVKVAPLERASEPFPQAVVLPLPDETYYLIEVRERIGFDSDLPDSGVLIYHIDERGVRPVVRVELRIGGGNLKTGAAFHVGEIFHEELYNLYISILSKDFHGYTLKINLHPKRDIILDLPAKVSALQPVTATVKVLVDAEEPKLNVFLDGRLYRVFVNPPDEEYVIPLQFDIDQSGDHVVKVVFVDPLLGIRLEAARRIYVEASPIPSLLLYSLPVMIAAAIVVFAVWRYRMSRMKDQAI